MPRTRTADAGRKSRAAQGRESVVAVSGRSHPIPRRAVVTAAMMILSREHRTATLSIAFIGRERMRRLNQHWKGRAEPTDVLAFALAGPGGSLAGDVYICPWVAARNARALGTTFRLELLRLVVHGVLHTLGHDHPEGAGRTVSPMWRRQERYLRELR